MKENYLSHLSQIVDNKLPTGLARRDFFTAIIGTKPSKGARSPSLWNRCYKELNLNAEMIALDVKLSRLDKVMQILSKIEAFQGGSCAVPHKTKILKFMDFIDSEAELSEATNCFFKNNSFKFEATNTDGQGAIKSLENLLNKKYLPDSKVLLIGLGGAGKAVASSIALKQSNKGHLYISNRNKKSLEDVFRKLKKVSNISKIKFPPEKDFLNKVNIIINATSIGYQENLNLLNYNPIGLIDNSKMKNFNQSLFNNHQDSLDKMLCLKEKKIFFDVIYQPLKSNFLATAELNGHVILGGLEMNKFQAALGFKKVNQKYISKKISTKKILSIMSKND